MAPATSAVPLLAAILAAVLVSSAAAAAGPPPNLPHQYSVDRNKTECGGGQGGTCGAYSSRFHFDWDSRASLEVMDLSPTTYKVSLDARMGLELGPDPSLLTSHPLGRPSFAELRSRLGSRARAAGAGGGGISGVCY